MSASEYGRPPRSYLAFSACRYLVRATGYDLMMGLFSKSVETGVLSESPRIEVIDDFATADECAHIIELARHDMGNASIIKSDGTTTESTLRRTADIGWVYTDQTPIIRSLVKRASETAGLPVKNCERIQVVHYEAGGKYTPHLDTYRPDPSNEHYRRAGQRLKTGLLYLHEPTKGGATSFPKAKAKVKPKVGRLTLFDLVQPGTAEPDAKAVHAGTPVWSGDKWVCNFWFCERPVPSASRKGRPNSSQKATKRRKKRR